MSKKFEESVYHLVGELKHFDYTIESIDQIWDVIFPHQSGSRTVYHHIRVTKYQKTFYIHHYDGNLPSLDVQTDKSVQATSSFSSSHEYRGDVAKGWEGLIASARNWLKVVQRDWTKANRQVWLNYPLNRRQGIVCHSLVRALPLGLRRIDQELGKAKSKKFIRLVEQGELMGSRKAVVPSMTANDYFEYCKIAYLSGRSKDDHVEEGLSGREMYKRYADGRDEGLLEIDGNSQEEFAAWIDGKHPKRSRGGHPWEIKRGGNTTHIDLFVSRPDYYEKTGFIVGLSGAAISRLKETICMFLGIREAGLPITINDPEGIRKRLLGQDNIGIVPCSNSLHRANQDFYEHQSVYDVMRYDDLGRYKSRITPFITWEPLPLLRGV
jgi:hypothetical protein